MKKKQRRGIEEFSVSFLDVICCGFGAVILLLMITKTVEPQIIEAAAVNLEGTLAKLQEQLFEIRGETRTLNRELNAKQEQLSEHEERIAILNGELASAKSRRDAIMTRSKTDEAISGQLALAKQRLTDEMRRLQRDRDMAKSNLIAGIPADSEYIVFVIDTSPSMVDVRAKMVDVMGKFLDSYPQVKGLQIVNGQGKHLLTTSTGRTGTDRTCPTRSTVSLRRSGCTTGRDATSASTCSGTTSRTAPCRRWWRPWSATPPVRAMAGTRCVSTVSA